MSTGQTFLLYAIGGLLALYLLAGVAILQWTWRELDRRTENNRRLYWRAAVILVMLWPKALHDVRNDGDR